MSERRTRSGGAAQRSEIRTPRTKPSKRLQRKSGSDLPNILPEIWPKASHSVPLRKTIVLKKIVAHSVEAPALHTLRRSPRISFKLEKENSPPLTVATEEELLKICAVPGASANTLVLRTENAESNSGEGELDARDLEMSQKVRRSYSRLGSSTSASTSTPGRRSFPGLQGPEALQGLSPVVGSKLIKIPDEPAKPVVPDTTLPGISPPVTKVKRKKVPEILSPTGRQSAHSKQVLKTAMQPAESEVEEPGDSSEPSVEPPSEQKSDSELEPTVTFLFTLLNTPEHKDSETDTELEDSRYLSEEDWGPRRTTEEMENLQMECQSAGTELSSKADSY